MLPRQPLRFLLADDPGRRQDDHGRALHQGADRSAATSRRCLIVCPGQPRRAVAGRAVPEVRPRASRSSPPTARASPRPATRFREDTRCSSPGSTSSRATRTSRPSSRRPTGTWSSSTRRTRCRPTTSAARSRRRSATSSASCSVDVTPPPPADDRDAAQRQGGGLPALPGPARRGPLRGQVSAMASTPSTPRT